MHTHTHTHNYVSKRNSIPLSEGHSSQLGPTVSSLRIQIFFFLYILSYFSNGNLIFFLPDQISPFETFSHPNSSATEQIHRKKPMQQDTCHLQLSIMAPGEKHEELNTAALCNGLLLLWAQHWSLSNAVVSHVLSIAVRYCGPQFIYVPP